MSWLLCSGPRSLYCGHLLWPWSRLRLPRGGNRFQAHVLTGHTQFLVVVGLWGSISAACASFLVSIGQLTPGSWRFQNQREPFLRRTEGRRSCGPSHTPHCPGRVLWLQETQVLCLEEEGPHKPMNPRRQSGTPVSAHHTAQASSGSTPFPLFMVWVISIFTFLLTPVLSQQCLELFTVYSLPQMSQEISFILFWMKKY